MNDERPYLIPQPISLRYEFFPGWGWPEMRVVLLGLMVGGIGICQCHLGGAGTRLVAHCGPDLAECRGLLFGAARDSWHVLLGARGGLGSLSATTDTLSL